MVGTQLEYSQKNRKHIENMDALAFQLTLNRVMRQKENKKDPKKVLYQDVDQIGQSEKK